MRLGSILWCRTGLKQDLAPRASFNNKIIPIPFILLYFKTYLNRRYFLVRSGTEHSNISPILAGVHQGEVTSPTLYNIYSADQSTYPNTQIAEYAYEKAIYSIHSDPDLVSTSLQIHFNSLSHWYSNWRVKINENKSVYTTFALHHSQSSSVHINNKLIPNSDTTKYHGLRQTPNMG